MDEHNLSGIKNILDSIITGVDSGSVSVKDVSKSKESVSEIKNRLPSLINTKVTFEIKKKQLIKKLDSFDLNSLQNSEKDLNREEDNISDIS